ncbi:MAG: nucleotidyl transferase AbiEii/AbiGii toxin family protein [Patescibacteria group bacterium]
MRKEILTEEQLRFLPMIKSFSDDFGLVGGTAMALQIGHRRSVDFDLFTDKSFGNLAIQKKIKRFTAIESVLIWETEELTFVAGGVKFTFFRYPYKISYSENLNDVIKLPDILTLAAMKSFSLGRRAKWKDYVDLYFVMKDYYDLREIVKRAENVFSSEFNEKTFRSQLAYFDDIDYTEEVIYMEGFKTENEIIKKKLIEHSLS